MTIEKNKELIRRYVEEVYNKQDLEAYMGFVAGEMAEQGADYSKQFFTAFPDTHCTVLDMLAEGDKVLGRLRITGTNNGPFRRPACDREEDPVRLISGLPYRRQQDSRIMGDAGPFGSHGATRLGAAGR